MFNGKVFFKRLFCNKLKMMYTGRGTNVINSLYSRLFCSENIFVLKEGWNGLYCLHSVGRVLQALLGVCSSLFISSSYLNLQSYYCTLECKLGAI